MTVSVSQIARDLTPSQIAELLDELANCHSQKLADAMEHTGGHRYTQATRVRLTLNWLRAVARQPDYQVDGRNQKVVEQCKAIDDLLS